MPYGQLIEVTFIVIVCFLLQKDVLLDEPGEGAVALLETTPIIYNDRHEPHDQEDEGGGECHGEDEGKASHIYPFWNRMQK